MCDRLTYAYQHIVLNLCCCKDKVAYVPVCIHMLYMYIMMFNLFDSYFLKAFCLLTYMYLYAYGIDLSICCRKGYFARWECEGREEVDVDSTGHSERDFKEFGGECFDFEG